MTCEVHPDLITRAQCVGCCVNEIQKSRSVNDSAGRAAYLALAHQWYELALHDVKNAVDKQLEGNKK